MRQEFELFDIKKDPYNIINLASNPDYQTILHELAKKLHERLKKDGDPHFNGYDDIFESYPRVSNIRSFMGGFKERGKYNPKYLQLNQRVDPKRVGKIKLDQQE